MSGRVPPTAGRTSHRRGQPTRRSTERGRRPVDRREGLARHPSVAGRSRRIEAVSFAHPRLVPAMADAEAVMERVPRVEGVAYSGPVLNRRGLDRALAAGVDEVNVVVVRQRHLQPAQPERLHRREHAGRGDVIEAGRRTVSSPRSRWRLPSAARSRARFPDRVVELAREGASRRRRDLPRRHDRRRRAAGSRRSSGGARRGGPPAGVAVPLPQHPQHRLRQRVRGRGRRRTVLDASAGGIGGCPFAPAPPATSPPTTWSTCWSGWASGPASTLTPCYRPLRS